MILFIYAAVAFLCAIIFRMSDHHPGDIITYRRFIIHQLSATGIFIAVAFFILTILDRLLS